MHFTKTLSRYKYFLGAIALTLIAEKATAQANPAIPIIVEGLSSQGVRGGQGNLAQWANVELAKGIYAQMRAGTDVVIRSELFTSICFVALLIAGFMLLFLATQWIVRVAEVGAVIPINVVEILVPIFLCILLVNPIGQGFAMQKIVLATGDLFNSMQTYILTNGGNATLEGGSAVTQANTKAEVEQSIRRAQVTCSATLKEEERRTCYTDAYDSVSASLDPYRDAQWAKNLSLYASDALLKNGKNADQLTSVGGAIGGVVGGATKDATDAVVNFGTGLISPGLYGVLLLVSSAMGLVIGILQLLTALFFPLSVSLSLAPVFRGSWIKWFTGMFQIWLSGLFLRMLVTILAIITVAGSSVSGGLYVMSATIITFICGIMAIFSVVSTVTGIANNVTNNVANLR